VAKSQLASPGGPSGLLAARRPASSMTLGATGGSAASPISKKSGRASEAPGRPGPCCVSDCRSSLPASSQAANGRETATERGNGPLKRARRGNLNRQPRRAAGPPPLTRRARPSAGPTRSAARAAAGGAAAAGTGTRPGGSAPAGGLLGRLTRKRTTDTARAHWQVPRETEGTSIQPPPRRLPVSDPFRSLGRAQE
jgi:hypothetical protein